jgi:hypothetical protein
VRQPGGVATSHSEHGHRSLLASSLLIKSEHDKKNSVAQFDGFVSVPNVPHFFGCPNCFFFFALVSVGRTSACNSLHMQSINEIQMHDI